MKIEELAEAYRRNAEEILRNQDLYGVSALNQAYILLRRDVEKALKALARKEGRCISCAHSIPDEKHPVDLRKRDASWDWRKRIAGAGDLLDNKASSHI